MDTRSTPQDMNANTLDPQYQDLGRRWEDALGEIALAARAAGRDPAGVRLVAVSKFHPAAAVRALFALGQRMFGESYIQEALDKQDQLRDVDIEWHLIGGLQTNKAKFVPGRFHLLHSLDSAKLARTLHKRAVEAGLVQPVLIQVNLACEEQKCGVAAGELDVLAEEVAGLAGLSLQGLMILPPWFDDPERTRPLFAELRRIRDALSVRLGLPLPELSMGMSDDYAVAVAEGATLVRIGTRIFGPRPGKR